MKKLLKPEIEFIEFNTQDVITTSGGGQINFSNPKNQVDPDSGSPANQTGWSTPTFNK